MATEKLLITGTSSVLNSDFLNWNFPKMSSLAPRVKFLIYTRMIVNTSLSLWSSCPDVIKNLIVQPWGGGALMLSPYGEIAPPWMRGFLFFTADYNPGYNNEN